jgi:hypothetical protein
VWRSSAIGRRSRAAGSEGSLGAERPSYGLSARSRSSSSIRATSARGREIAHAVGRAPSPNLRFDLRSAYPALSPQAGRGAPTVWPAPIY